MNRAAWIASVGAVGSLGWWGLEVLRVGPSDPLVRGLVGFAIESTWAFGVFGLAAPLEDAGAVARGLGASSRVRVLARFLPIAWPIQVAGKTGAAVLAAGPLRSMLEWTSWGLAFIGLVGLVLLAIHLRRWAEWLGDETAVKWAELFLWAVGGVPGFLLLAVLAAAISPPFFIAPMFGVVACAFGVLVLLPGAILSIARSLAWTTQWQRRREERDEELQAQVAERASAPPRPAVIEEGPLPLADEGTPPAGTSRTR